jgi:hypothetical protein
VATARKIAEAAREARKHNVEVAHAFCGRITPSPSTPLHTGESPMEAPGVASLATEQPEAPEIHIEVD